MNRASEAQVDAFYASIGRARPGAPVPKAKRVKKAPLICPWMSLDNGLQAGLLVQSPNKTKGMHEQAMARITRQHRNALIPALLTYPGPQSFDRGDIIACTLTRYAVDSRPGKTEWIDDDNFPVSLKGVRDTVACWILFGALPPTIPIGQCDGELQKAGFVWDYQQEQLPERRMNGVRIEFRTNT